MLQRDYLSKLIESFTKQMEVYLKDAVILRKTESIGEVEEALGELLELDPDMLLSLSPDSLVTMIALGGNGDALGDSVAYVLARLGDAEAQRGDKETAALRRQQARAVALGFGFNNQIVPEQFKDLDKEIQDARAQGRFI
ncbi:hypothetical protein AAK684_03660 [Leptogranulimonas caecicola]|uniref:Uncharacterized protein n=2 Tax=Coriobacteriales TaxID=84999 RepID=A0A4V3RRI2_9ACTN|nr:MULTISPECIES: hypothetical protein [Atopobiaceae]TGY63470.1 hypothetical protein E5334_02950 [Muricaecibacterium torontonense]BCV19065.1 hypothetical protein ATOBIA_N13550 [Atopobiaceae bacterium P1]BDC91459.1 hypothetical protein ATTO_13310 [Leptogranulimonas caecicola]